MITTLFDHVPMDTDDYKLMIETAFFLGYLGRYNEAQTVFDGILAMTPACESALLGIGNLYTVQGQFGAAEDAYRNNLRLHPTSAIGHFYLAELLLGLGRIESGVESLNRAISLDSGGSIGKMSRQLEKLVELGFFRKK